MGWKLLIFGVIVLVFAVSVMFEQPTDTRTNKTLFADETQCETGAECVPAECCHAAQCVPLSQKPDCAEVVCTQECRPGTLDCGQMSCGCVKGKCVTKLF